MRKIIDINKNEIKDGDKVYNFNVKSFGRMKYVKEKSEKYFEGDWWYFISDDGTWVGVPDFISDSKQWGIERVSSN